MKFQTLQKTDGEPYSMDRNGELKVPQKSKQGTFWDFNYETV